MTSHSDMQKIRIIGLFFENRTNWKFEVDKRNSTNGCFDLHVYLRKNKSLLHNSLYVFDQCGENLSHKMT